MGELFPLLLSGIGFPLLMLVISRYYTSNPNAWEEIALFAVLGVAAMGIGIWALSAELFEAGSLGRFLVVVLAGWSMLFGLIALVASGAQAKDAIEGTRKEQ